VRNRPGATSVAELALVAWMFAIVLAGIARFAGDQNRLAVLQRDRRALPGGRPDRAHGGWRGDPAHGCQ
jgi:hypothetical protein